MVPSGREKNAAVDLIMCLLSRLGRSEPVVLIVVIIVAAGVSRPT